MTTETVTRSGSETRRRSHVVPLRLDDNELAELDRLCLAHGISRQQVLRAGITYFTATEPS